MTLARLLPITLAALMTWSSVTDASQSQQAVRLRSIGVVAISVSEESEEATAFRNGLHDAGYIEGRDISISWWYGHGSYDHVSQAVADLVQRRVDVIVVEGAPAALAAKRATDTIPIVMALVGDPVGIGVVQSLARPGANVTGLTNQTVDLMTKRLQLLKEAVPKASRVAVLFNPDTPFSERAVAAVKSAAPGMGLKLKLTSVRTTEEVGVALATLNQWKVDAVMPIDDAFMTAQVPAILQAASKARVPVVYAHKPLVRRGVLLSYAVRHTDMFHQAADYVDRILKGAPPGSLPVEQPTKFELVINLRTAETLGLKIPQSVLAQADEIIR
jgi:putative ABC transport system substrate-binding protein